MDGKIIIAIIELVKTLIEHGKDIKEVVKEVAIKFGLSEAEVFCIIKGKI